MARLLRLLMTQEANINEKTLLPSPAKTLMTITPKLTAWAQALRWPFFITSLLPACLALLLAVKNGAAVSVLDVTLLLAGILSLHAATNLSNDIFDALQGIDTPENLGGSRVLQQGKLSMRELKAGTAVAYLASIVCFALLIYCTGLPLLWLFFGFGLFSSYFYVAPPIYYGYRGFGELFVFFNMGLGLLLGSYIALTGSFALNAFFISLPFGLMSAQILFFQSLPEIETDPLAGKHTLASLLGKPRAVLFFKASYMILGLLLILFWAVDLLSWPVLGFLLLVPLYLKLARLLNFALSGNSWPSLDACGYLPRIIFFLATFFICLGLIFN